MGNQANRRDPERGLFSGSYDVARAALYLRATMPRVGTTIDVLRRPQRQPFVVTSRHLYWWIRRGLDWGELGRRERQSMSVSFLDLIRLRMIAVMRAHGVPLRVIRRSEAEARRLTHRPNPFVTEELWTNSSDVFVRVANELLAVSKYGQGAMAFLEDFLTPVHHGLVFGQNEVVERWTPVEGITIDPQIEFGAPCLDGTRVQTEVLWSMFNAGDGLPELADMFGIQEQQVRAALDWEQGLAEAA